METESQENHLDTKLPLEDALYTMSVLMSNQRLAENNKTKKDKSKCLNVNLEPRKAVILHVNVTKRI